MSATTIPKITRTNPSRRHFLKSSAIAAGTFLLGAYIPFPEFASAQGQNPDGVFDPNFFVKISPDNMVTVISKHFEMGQGVTTGLATLVAEELEADWSKVRFEFAPVDARYYNNLLFGPFMGTGGSSSMAEAWVQMRKVGAAARMMLISAAAAKWNVPAAEIKVEKSVVTHASSGRHATFGDLAGDAMHEPVPTAVTLKGVKEWELIGTRIPRLDSVQKTNGSGIFAIDIRRPGMLTAVVKHPDVFGGKVVSFDATEAKKIDGVVDVFQIPSGVAVLAKDTWAAIEGRTALKVTWDTSKAETRSTSAIFDAYREQAKGQGNSAENRGDAAQAITRAAKTHEAEFTFPYLAHAPMEPLNCVMEFRGDNAELWSGCQLHRRLASAGPEAGSGENQHAPRRRQLRTPRKSSRRLGH
jgi:isoquinoline 1-oxidoreductase beta subunit